MIKTKEQRKKEGGLKEAVISLVSGWAFNIYTTNRCLSEFFTTSFSAVETYKNKVTKEVIAAREI